MAQDAPISVAQTSICTEDGCRETEVALLARAPRGVSPGSGRQKLPACRPRIPGAASREPGSPETLLVCLRQTGSVTLSPLQGSSCHSSALPHLPSDSLPTNSLLPGTRTVKKRLGLLRPRNVHVLSPLPRRGSPLPLTPHPGTSLSTQSLRQVSLSRSSNSHNACWHLRRGHTAPARRPIC